MLVGEGLVPGQIDLVSGVTAGPITVNEYATNRVEPWWHPHSSGTRSRGEIIIVALRIASNRHQRNDSRGKNCNDDVADATQIHSPQGPASSRRAIRPSDAWEHPFCLLFS